MAVEPVFHKTMEDLKAALRLTGATQPDTITIVERVTQEVRVGFYEKLGETRVTEILSFAVEENPTSADPLTRLKAINTETCWVKWRLIHELPVLFMDSSGNVDQAWNEEGLTREASARDLKALAKALEAKVLDALEDLAGVGDSGSARVFTIEPETTPPRPFESLYPPKSLNV